MREVCGWHYTPVENTESILKDGLRPGQVRTDTVTINEILMGVEHSSGIDRTKCIFLSAVQPRTTSSIAVLQIDLSKLNPDLLFVADFGCVDNLWRLLKYSPHKSEEIQDRAEQYWDSISPFSEEHYMEEDEIEYLHLGEISADFIKMV